LEFETQAEGMYSDIIEQEAKDFKGHTFLLVYYRDEAHSQAKLSDFQVVNMIGKGSISNVYLVRRKSDNKPFAMKCIQKELILDDELFKSTKLEKDLLTKVESPFFVNLHYSFQSDTKIIFLIDFVRGGDLFMHMTYLGSFEEDIARFLIA
jgi:serum/glucocorticoid-regulated kinase 2